ncbi:MAG: hypothetical protein VYD54_14490 [Bdellovibrionota bacterium]|nr:hypothetical protein [Bdellovibrionota bacterium]
MYLVCKKMVSAPVLNMSLTRAFLKADEIGAHATTQSIEIYKKEIEKETGSLKL